jgi:hypothetical protein
MPGCQFEDMSSQEPRTHMRRGNSEPRVVIAIVAAEVRKVSGDTFSYATTLQIMTQLNDFPVYQQAEKQYFTSTSPLSEERSISYLWAADQRTHVVPTSLRWQTFDVARQYFMQMLADPTLMKFVNAPLS